MRGALAGLMVVSLALAAPGAAAQESVRPGDRVRVVTEDAPRRTGSVLRSDAAGVVIHLESGDTMAAAWPSLRSLEVGLGASRGRGALRGAGLGALAGAAIGFTIGILSGDDRECFICFSAEEKAALGAVVFGGAGAVVGAAAGASSPRERWRPLPLPAPETEGGGIPF